MQMKKLPKKLLLAYGALLLATALWAAAGPIIKLTLDYIPLFSFLFYRFLIVCILMLPFVYIELKKKPVKNKHIPTFVLLGLLGQSGILLVFAGIKYTSAIDAGIIGAIAPIMIIAAGHYFYKEKINKKLELGIAIATIGTFLVILEPAFANAEGTTPVVLRILGNILVLLYNVVFAAYLLLSKKVMGQKSDRMSKTLQAVNIEPLDTSYSPFIHTALSFYVALATFLPFAILESLGVFGASNANFSIFDLTTVPLLGLMYMAVVSSIIAYTAFQWGLDNARIADSGIFSYLGPVFTIPFAFIIIGEVPTTTALIGTAIIAVGVIIAEKRR